jgi:hypothetical protein
LAPKIFGRNFADLGEFPPNQQILAGHWTKFAQIEKKSPTNFGVKLNLTELLCNFYRTPNNFPRTDLTILVDFSTYLRISYVAQKLKKIHEFSNQRENNMNI